jgi:hypothetical protein
MSIPILSQNIIFEIIPPPRSWETEKVLKWIDDIEKIVKKEDIVFINLPEIIDESRGNEKRNFPFEKKLDNLKFSHILQRRYSSMGCILNKIIVRRSRSEFCKWVEQAYGMGIRQLLLIGGESHEIEYQGFSVEEGASYIKQNFPEIEIGGVTIFTRNNEAMRIYKKMQCGIDFFCSQIIFETGNFKQIVLELKEICEANQIAFPKLFISLSPASEIRDLSFIKWLGVEFPSAVYSYLIDSPSEVEKRCFSILDRILDEIFYFQELSELTFGFNIEHVRYTNLQLASQLIGMVKSRQKIQSK